jgi:hypothetical protein
MLNLLLLLPLLAAPCIPIASSPVPLPPADRELDEAAQRLRRASASRSKSERKEALASLVALESGGAATILEGEFARSSQKWHRQADDLVRTVYLLERKEEMLALMELRAERDPSLSASLNALCEEIADLAETRDRQRSKAEDAKQWGEELGRASVELFARLGSGARRKAEEELWRDAEGHPARGVRIGAVELLGRVAGKGAALRLHKLLRKAFEERVRIQQQIPRLEKEVREFERRLQEELVRQGGGISPSSDEQYNRLRREAAGARSEVTRLAYFVDAAARAAGAALDREEGKVQEKSLSALVRAFEKGRDGLGMRTLDVLRHATSRSVVTRLVEILAETSEPLVRSEIIDVLGDSGDLSIERGSIETALIETHLSDESWMVRSRTASALARLRSRAAIPALIARFEAEQGRVRTDLAAALTSLTGKRFGVSAATWARWWREEGDRFEVPAEEPELEGSLDARESLGVTFFGIKTTSQRVLVLFDVSGSMNYSMVPRGNPTDQRGQPPDLPREGEDSRLEAAKRELVKAFGGIRDGGLFNIVLYATDVWTWKEKLVEMDTEARSEALRFAENLTAVGGTNIYGALSLAFERVGVEEGDEWCDPLVDTIFLLSDGRASMGVTVDADEILSFVRERNRAAGIVIHTIGLSGAQDAYLLRSLAEENGGAYAAR